MNIHCDRFKLVTVLSKLLFCPAVPLKQIHNMHYFGVMVFNLLGHRVCWIDGTSGCSNPQIYPGNVNTISPASNPMQLTYNQRLSFGKGVLWIHWKIPKRGSPIIESSNHRCLLLSRGHGLAKNWRKEVKETSLRGRNLRSLKWFSWRPAVNQRWSQHGCWRNLRRICFFFQKTTQFI